MRKLGFLLSLIIFLPLIVYAKTSYSDLFQSSDEVEIGETIYFSVQLTDNSGLKNISITTNETGKWVERIAYPITGESYYFEYPWRSYSVKEGMVIGWYLEIGSKDGTITKTKTLSFIIKGKGLPICPEECESGIEPDECSIWSECENNTQIRICYTCDEITDWKCKSNEEERECAPNLFASEVRNLVLEVRDLIEELKIQNLDTINAEKLWRKARNALSDNDLDNAKKYAEQAQDALVSLSPKTDLEPEEKKDFTFVWIFVIIFIGVILSATLLRKRILNFLKMKKKLEEKMKKKEVPKPEPKRCAICGRPLKHVYKCADCEKEICYNHARTYKNKTYCVNCLKERGLM